VTTFLAVHHPTNHRVPYSTAIRNIADDLHEHVRLVGIIRTSAIHPDIFYIVESADTAFLADLLAGKGFRP
jgi:hypothetical protein